MFVLIFLGKQVIANGKRPLMGKVHWEQIVKKVSRFGIRTGTFNCSSDPRYVFEILFPYFKYLYLEDIIEFYIWFHSTAACPGNYFVMCFPSGKITYFKWWQTERYK